MSRLKVDDIRQTGASSDAISLDASGNTTLKGNTTINGNLTVNGTNNISSGRYIIEQFFTPADGSTIATANGDITVTNVTGSQTLSDTHTTFEGSEISYNPPTGTTQVIYEFHFSANNATGNSGSHLIHYKLNFDGNDITHSRKSQYHHANGEDANPSMVFKWGINIGGITDNDTGRIDAWNTAKTIKVMGRRYGSGNEARINNTFYWDQTNADITQVPCVGITAIG